MTTEQNRSIDTCAELITILDSQPAGRILLVVDPKLIAPLKLVVAEGSKVLREHRVDSILPLRTAAIETDCENVLYLARPSFHIVKLVAAQVKALRPAGKAAPKNLRLYFVPRRTFVCEKMLRDEGGARCSLGALCGSHPCGDRTLPAPSAPQLTRTSPSPSSAST